MPQVDASVMVHRIGSPTLSMLINYRAGIVARATETVAAKVADLGTEVVRATVELPVGTCVAGVTVGAALGALTYTAMHSVGDSVNETLGMLGDFVRYGLGLPLGVGIHCATFTATTGLFWVSASTMGGAALGAVRP